MPNTIETIFDPSTALTQAQTDSVHITTGWIRIYNESPYGLSLMLSDGTIYFLPAYVRRILYIDQPDGAITYKVLFTYGFAPNTTPVSKVIIESMQPSDINSLPVADLISLGSRQTNQGAGPLTSSQQIIQDGVVAGTVIVEATPLNSAQTINWLTDGTLVISGVSNGVFSKILQLVPGDATHFAVIKMDNGGLATTGSGQLNGTLFQAFCNTLVNGDSDMFNANDAAGSGKVWSWVFKADGSIYFKNVIDNAIPLSISNTGIKSANGALCQGWSRFTGTGSGTFNHGLGVVPNHFTPCQSVAGSETMGYNTVTSTQVTIQTGAGNAFTAEAKLY